ncbi:hypothetical protein [Shigella phage ESH35]|nr:hypothetical protein [Shigella phage ESH35]
MLLSEKPITVKEFQEKVKLFAQELINKVSERFPETSVRVITETPRSVLVIVNPGDGDQISHLKLDFDGLVEAQRVYGVL